MFKTEADALQYARRHAAVCDEIWKPETEWTEDFFAQSRAKDVQHVWQDGSALSGIKEMLAHWSPMKGVFVQHKTLGVEVETFAETMVTFKQYSLFKTFQGKEFFMVSRAIVNVNSEGKVEREVYIMDQQYWDDMKRILVAFSGKN